MKHTWIKKGDRVVVICGNDRGQVGTVLAKKGERIVVQGVNVRKCHMKRRTQEQRSDIVSVERPIHISNVAPCNADGTPLKLKSHVDENANRQLVYFDNDKMVSYRTLRKSKHRDGA